MFGELLPNLWSTIIVFFTLNIANNMLLEAALSFLGAGVQPPNSSWGTMVSLGFESIYTSPLLAFAPGVMIMLTVLSLNVFGDGLRDALDPKSKVRLRRAPGRPSPRGGRSDGPLRRQAPGRDGAGAVRGLGPGLRDLQRDPQLRPGPADGRQERDPDAGQEHRRGLGLRRTAAGPVRDDDEEDLHRRTDLLRGPAQRRRPDRRRDSRRPSRSASAPR